MKKIFIYLILLIFSLSLVSAVEVSTDTDDYNSGDTANIDVTDCAGTSILKVINPGFNVVDIKSGSGSWSTSYNTLSDSADGKYTISVTCENGDATGNFCVDDPDCLGIQVQQQPSAPQGGTPGGGVSCQTQWSCSDWSYCNNELKQTRDCTDLNNCEQPRQEFRDCSSCDESWICSTWSACSNRINTRNCFDEHECGTVLLKPDLQKSCRAAASSGPQPAQVSNRLFPPSFAQPQKSSALKQFWDDYKLLLILGLLGLILLLVIILLLVHFLKPKHYAYNLDELKEWVRKERAMGTSNEDIRAILIQHTGWKDEEIDKAFESLRAKPLPKQKPLQPTAKKSAKISEYTAAKEEPTVKVNNKPVMPAAVLPSKNLGGKKHVKRPLAKKLKKFSEERTLFKRSVKKKPMKVISTSSLSRSRRPPAKKKVRVFKRARRSSKKEKEPARKTSKASKSKRSSGKKGRVTTTTTTTVRKVKTTDKGKKITVKKTSRKYPKKEVRKTVKTTVVRGKKK